MEVYIVGAGAMGMLLASRLELAGTPVTLITRRPEQAALLRGQGLLLIEHHTSTRSLTRPAVLSIEEAVTQACRHDAPMMIVLTVKQTAFTETFIAQLAALAGGANSAVCCIQNGIGHMEKLAAALSASKLLAAVTTEGAMKQSDRETMHTGAGETWIGHISPEGDKAPGDMPAKLQKLLEAAGFRAFVSNNMNNRVWNKLLINAVINPLTAVLRVRNGELLQLPEAMKLMRELFDEGESLAKLYGTAIDADLWDKLLEVCRATANNRSSMLQDILAERGTEIEAVNGGLLALAATRGMRLKAHEAVYCLVKSIELQQRLRKMTDTE